MHRVVIILICLSLTACSNYTLLRKPGWLKNPFSKSSPASSPPTNARNAVEKIWYCYPVAGEKEWDCQDHPGPNQDDPAADVISSLPPGQPTSLVASVASPTPPPPVPELIPRPEPESIPESPLEAVARSVSPQAEAEITALERNVRLIMNHPDDYLAVQLIALESLAEIEAYTDKQHIEDPLYARILTRDGKLIVLLLGIYPDRDAANQAVYEWTTTHKVKDRPWIRKLDVLIAAMNGAQGDG
jgi:septal ring-binding cell division protein DamX